MAVVHGAEINAPRKGGVLLVGEAYGEDEEDAGRPFVGAAGQLLDDLLAYGGFRREDVNITNVVNARPPGDDNDFHRFSDAHVRQGEAELDRLVKRLQPKLIVTVGNPSAAHFVPDWPTGGRGIIGAKGIEERRGYFWETPAGWVLTLLHPAAALRKMVPGYELCRRDFVRAKRWLQGKLPREAFPPCKTLRTQHVPTLLRNDALAFDIETKWNRVFCCGFTGDDLQPYVAKYGEGLRVMGTLLAGREGLHGVAHNGPFDADMLDREGYPTALYTDDTQSAWWALEPELASRDEGDAGGRMTKKSLVFLGSLDPFNLPYWKAPWARPGYPEWECGYPLDSDDDATHARKLSRMGGWDSYVTRRRWTLLQAQMRKEGVEEQYRLAFETNLRCITMTRRGWRVDEALRQERMATLEQRAEQAKQESMLAGLAYIEKHAIDAFKVTKQCPCCGGGLIARHQCWRCAGFARKPTKAMLLANRTDPLGDLAHMKRDELEAFLLAPCTKCQGQGSTFTYVFNPYSGQKLRTLLYDNVGAPQWVFKRKVKMDEMAQQRMLQWAEEGK
jgi:uracil-DNA glycosylase family 4